MQPLQDITVIDFSKVFAGPYCTQYLGDLGARVIKVEPVEGGDDTRSWQPQAEGQSSTFLALNRNKRSLALDLKTPEGRSIVHKLVASADVVVQGFKGGTAPRLGIDYATLKPLNDRLVYCEISGYGQDGPLGGDPGYDVMLQAFSGMVSTMGEPQGPAVRASFSPVDIGTGMHAVSGILAALMERANTGRGSHVELTLLDSAMAWMAYLTQNYWMTGEAPGRLGTGHGSLVPYQGFSASDGDLMIGAGNDAQWRRLCAVLALQEYAESPRYASNSARVENRPEVVELVQSVIGRESLAHWLEVLGDAGIPCAPINTLPQALAHPQLEARRMVVHSQHPVLGRLPHIGMPLVFNGGVRGEPEAAPLLGQHSAEILRDVGYSKAEIDQFSAAGIIGTCTQGATP